MTTLTQLQETMTAFLTGQGVRARTAWPGEDRLVRTAPLAVVRVKEVAAAPAGVRCAGTWTCGGQRWRSRCARRAMSGRRGDAAWRRRNRGSCSISRTLIHCAPLCVRMTLYPSLTRWSRCREPGRFRTKKSSPTLLASAGDS